MDTRFMILSKDKQQITELKNYIQVLYDRKYDQCDEDRVMRGHDMHMLSYAAYYILVGCHYDLCGYDLGYWCQRENKNHLLTDVIYLEDEPVVKSVRLLKSSGRLSETGLLSYECPLYNYGIENPTVVYKEFPADLLPIVAAYFRGTANWEKILKRFRHEEVFS